MTDEELRTQYGGLYEAVCALPSKVSVDVGRVLRDYLSLYIHNLQRAIANNPTWSLEQVLSDLNGRHPGIARVFSVQDLKRGQNKEFSAVVLIAEMLGQKQGKVLVNHHTIAGMDEFIIEYDQDEREGKAGESSE